MCGIVGYIGNKQAAPILLEGLEKLEYRGYDSAGVAVRNGSGETEVVKAKGRLKVLKEKTNNGRALKGKCGIGHTRWATHGGPSEGNAHPHYSDDKNVVVVHNGIIENYEDLKQKLLKSNYAFYSQTDTEVLAKLIDYYYKKYGQDPLVALQRSMMRVRGSYALAVMFKDFPGEIFVARKDSPLIVGEKEGEIFIASDIPAILKYTRTVYYVGNIEMARLNKGGAVFYNIDREEIKKEPTTVEWDAQSAEKGGYEFFMMKEMCEQPKSVKDTLHAYLKDGEIDLSKTGLTEKDIKNIKNITVVACGSAYHAGVVLQYVTEELAKIPVRVEIASEFRYRKPLLNADDLVIVISQSGETADSIAALKEAQKLNVKTLGIVNVVDSSIAREAECVMYTYAGPEIAVATTKAYSAQLVAAYLLAVRFAVVRGAISEEYCKTLTEELMALPEKIEQLLSDRERIQWFAARFANAQDVFFIGRGCDYAISLEGSLKMKEISYIHSEAYAAGELKHGTISLIDDGILVVSILTQNELYEKTRSNMAEVKSRGAYIMSVTTTGNYSIESVSDFTVYVPETAELFAGSLAIIPLQLMAYYVSVAKGLDVDKPRNLAKSVTVE